MQNSTVTYMLIAVVLICPYLCLGEGVGGEPVARGSCGCSCSHHQEQPERDTPSVPLEQDADCFCHGAIMDVQLRIAERDHANPSTLQWLIDDTSQFSTAASLARISFEPSRQFPPFSTGRDVCMLTCTLNL